MDELLSATLLGKLSAKGTSGSSPLQEAAATMDPQVTKAEGNVFHCWVIQLLEHLQLSCILL